MGKPHRDRLSDDERKARRRASVAKYREANREKCVAASLICRAKNAEAYSQVQAQYRAENAERIKERNRLYGAANRERVDATTRRWQSEHADKFLAYQVDYRLRNAEHEKARVVKWRAENAERSKAYSKAWAKQNPEARRLMQHKRRARKIGGSVSPDIYKRLRVIQRGRCAVCRVDLSEAGEHLDHMTPLALGGAHEDSNLQLLCPPCNLSKGAKDPVEFMQTRGFLL